MTEDRNAMADLFAACWKDDALKARFMSDPKAVLAEYGIHVADGMDVTVLENSDNTVHITLPAPPEGAQKLTNEELASAAGGTNLAQCNPTTNFTCVQKDPACKG